MRVLILDDDRIALRATMRMLRHAGHEVGTACSTAEAARAIELTEPPFQALVTDHDLGEEHSGAYAARFLRKFLTGPQLVIVYTGNPIDAEREAPARAVVVKKPNLSLVLDALEQG